LIDSVPTPTYIQIPEMGLHSRIEDLEICNRWNRAVFQDHDCLDETGDATRTFSVPEIGLHRPTTRSMSTD
jgi:hypothetical protein